MLMIFSEQGLYAATHPCASEVVDTALLVFRKGSVGSFESGQYDQVFFFVVLVGLHCPNSVRS